MKLVISVLVLLILADISECLWNGVPQNQEDLSYMLDDETTPVKACGDLAYEVNQRGWFACCFPSMSSILAFPGFVISNKHCHFCSFNIRIFGFR